MSVVLPIGRLLFLYKIHMLMTKKNQNYVYKVCICVVYAGQVHCKDVVLVYCTVYTENMSAKVV